MKILLVATISALALVPAALAAKPAPSASITMSGTPVWGGQVSFTVSPDGFVNVNCYQNGELVMNTWASGLTGTAGPFGLYSPIWTGGAASCTADLVKPTGHGVIASMSFGTSS